MLDWIAFKILEFLASPCHFSTTLLHNKHLDTLIGSQVHTTSPTFILLATYYYYPSWGTHIGSHWPNDFLELYHFLDENVIATIRRSVRFLVIRVVISWDSVFNCVFSLGLVYMGTRFKLFSVWDKISFCKFPNQIWWFWWFQNFRIQIFFKNFNFW